MNKTANMAALSFFLRRYLLIKNPWFLFAKAPPLPKVAILFGLMWRGYGVSNVLLREGVYTLNSWPSLLAHSHSTEYYLDQHMDYHQCGLEDCLVCNRREVVADTLECRHSQHNNFYASFRHLPLLLLDNHYCIPWDHYSNSFHPYCWVQHLEGGQVVA